MGKLKKLVAIIGCGHSGTFYASEVFQHLGIDVRHELVGGDGIAGWNYTHLLPSQFPEFGLPQDSVVLHQVRHPLKVISSVQSMLPETWIDIAARVQARGYNWNPLDDPHPVRGMKYCLFWNYMAEGIADYRYRVEDMESELSVILEILGIPGAPMPNIPKTMNKHEYDHTFSWEELHAANGFLYEKIRELSKEYGYRL
jgi:hypothetical protein